MIEFASGIVEIRYTLLRKSLIKEASASRTLTPPVVYADFSSFPASSVNENCTTI